MLDLAAKEELLLVVTNLDWPDDIGETPLRDVATREKCGLLNVARRTSRHAIVPEDELLGAAATEAHHEVRLDLLPRDRDSIVLGQGERETERSAARHDSDFVQRIVAFDLDRADRVSRLVVRRKPTLLVLHHHRLPLGAEHDFVLRVLEVDHEDL